MRIVDAYLDPILKAAVEKAKHEKTGHAQENKEEIGEDDTLLDHLVRYTSGRSLLFEYRWDTKHFISRPQCAS